MKRLCASAVAFAALAAAPAWADLKPGSTAPDFTTQAYLAGKPFNYHLAEALKSGSVVVYFFPSAHTKGCNLEAHLFSEAADQFKAQAGFYPPDDTALEVAHVLDRAKTPNWKVVTKDQDKGPEFLPEGSRCAGFSS